MYASQCSRLADHRLDDPLLAVKVLQRLGNDGAKEASKNNFVLSPSVETTNLKMDDSLSPGLQCPIHLGDASFPPDVWVLTPPQIENLQEGSYAPPLPRFPMIFVWLLQAPYHHWQIHLIGRQHQPCLSRRHVPPHPIQRGSTRFHARTFRPVTKLVCVPAADWRVHATSLQVLYHYRQIHPVSLQHGWNAGVRAWWSRRCVHVLTQELVPPRVRHE